MTAGRWSWILSVGSESDAQVGRDPDVQGRVDLVSGFKVGFWEMVSNRSRRRYWSTSSWSDVDVSDGTTLGLSASAGPNVGVTISGVPSATLGASASLSPSISAHIRPGRITELSLGKKQLQSDHASIRVKRARVSVDGCLGKTSVRIIARLSVSTKRRTTLSTSSRHVRGSEWDRLAR